MAKYRLKKSTQEFEAWGRVYKSKTFKRLFLESGKCDNDYVKFLKDFKKLQPSSLGTNHNQNLIFSKKWLQGIKLPIEVGGKQEGRKIDSTMNIVVVNKPVVSMSETEYRNFLPLIAFNTQRILGAPANKSGRKHSLERNKAIRKKYKQLFKKKDLSYLIDQDSRKSIIDTIIDKSGTIITYLSQTYNLSENRITQIVYSKKYD